MLRISGVRSPCQMKPKAQAWGLKPGALLEAYKHRFRFERDPPFRLHSLLYCVL